MEHKFHDVLSSVDAKQGRSPLEPYGELVDTLRDQGLTCRDIAALLAEKCQFVTSKSAVSRFLLARARKRRNAARKLSRRVSGSTQPLPNRCLSIPRRDGVTTRSDRKSPM